MWDKHDQSISSGNDSTNLIAGRDIIYIANGASTEIIDQKIHEESQKLIQTRFFAEFDRTWYSETLGKRLTDGDLSTGTKETRERALAWCARILSRSEKPDLADNILKTAKTLGQSQETKIAESFVTSQKGDKKAALQILADIKTQASNSARLMIVMHHDGSETALSWISDAGLATEDLDSDGKSFLLTQQLQLESWDDAAQTISALTEEDFKNTPILHHWAALTALVACVPKDFRSPILTQVPIEVADFPLASDTTGINSRRAARKHFVDAVEVAKQLECPRAANIEDSYALWLELRDPEQNTIGIKRLEDKLSDPSTALGYVHYALQFGIKLDLDVVERDINQYIAINGELSIDTALARYALAFTQPTPEEIANYITHHYDQLATFINSNLMRHRQIEMFSQAGMPEKAKEILEQLIDEGIPEEDKSNLHRIISEAKGGDTIASRLKQYEKSQALNDLINLVGELEKHQRWDEICVYGLQLFEETHSLHHAERLVNALNNTHKSKESVDFLEKNEDLLSQSNHLLMSYAWGLYHEGALKKSRTVLSKLSDEAGTINYRALQVNLGISTGDWSSLTAYIANEYQNKDNRNSLDLISTAQLALHLDSPFAKDLVFEAAAKADDDPAILTNAYFIATSAGWEDDPKVFQWLEKAMKLSGDDGPLQSMSLKEVVDRRPEWERRESETWHLLTQGKLPISLAAKTLNRSLVDLISFPASANLVESDPRRRNAIPAYSGIREPKEIAISDITMVFDASALLTLGFLKILDKTIDTLDSVCIAHSTLGWLFEESQKATFHQPSRIANAHKVRDFIATGILDKFSPTSTANSELAIQVGDELAALIAEAELISEQNGSQCIVVRSSPVYRLSSFLQEEADLSNQEHALSSCLAVVNKLREKGQITAEEIKRATAYLQLHEKPWTNQPDIADGATLYLDDLSVTYLQHLNLLGKIKAAGLKAVISTRAVRESDTLLSYERISDQVKDIIEDIRASLNSNIKSGKVRVSRKHNFDDEDKRQFDEIPSFEALTIVSDYDALISDDRFLNKHAHFENQDKKLPIITSIDLLNTFVEIGIITDDNNLEYRTQLRKAGYFFIPVTEEELDRCLRESIVNDDTVTETAELKAIRESILHVRMSECLNLPEEGPWLNTILLTFTHVLRNLWISDIDSETTARSNWILEQIDIRGWAHSFEFEHANNIIHIGRANYILLLLLPLADVKKETMEAYWNWIDDAILSPMKEQFPEIYNWLVNWHSSHIADLVKNKDSLEGNQ